MSSTITTTTTTDNVVVKCVNNNENIYEFNNTESNVNKTNHMRNLRVHLGIDEDLKMILEMDPSIIDLGIQNVQEYNTNLTYPKVIGLPPKSGGYVL